MEKLGKEIEQMAGKIGLHSPGAEMLRMSFAKGQERARALSQWVTDHPQSSPFDIEAVKEWERQYDAFEKKLRGEGTVTYSCSFCHDTGWNNADSPAPCPYCSPYNPEESLRKYAGVPERRWRDRFESFNLKKAPVMTEAVKAAMEFAHRVSVPWLVLCGPIGCGKTHLCYAVANKMTQAGVVVRFWNVAYLLDVIRSTYGQKQAEDAPHESAEDMVYTPTVLILDDLGVEKPSDWVTEKLFEVIDRRYSEGKGLMVTTNESLVRLSPRLQSRFKDKEMCRIVVSDSPDFRTKLTAGKR